MTPAPTPVLTDRDVPPNDALIENHLGDAFDAWCALDTAVRQPPFNIEPTWIFYADGGWLCKALRGKKNLAWLGVWQDQASMTFYFAARHREDLVELDIPSEIRDQAAKTDMIGTMLPLPIQIRTREDVATALTVLRYKLNAK